MGSKCCNTDGRIVWTTRRIIMKNKPHLVTFYEKTLVGLWTFQPTFIYEGGSKRSIIQKGISGHFLRFFYISKWQFCPCKKTRFFLFFLPKLLLESRLDLIATWPKTISARHFIFLVQRLHRSNGFSSMHCSGHVYLQQWKLRKKYDDSSCFPSVKLYLKTKNILDGTVSITRP